MRCGDGTPMGCPRRSDTDHWRSTIRISLDNHSAYISSSLLRDFMFQYVIAHDEYLVADGDKGLLPPSPHEAMVFRREVDALHLLNEIGLGFSLKGTGADPRRMPETAATRVVIHVSF